jgi:hypothetical protein
LRPIRLIATSSGVELGLHVLVDELDVASSSAGQKLPHKGVGLAVQAAAAAGRRLVLTGA